MTALVIEETGELVEMMTSEEASSITTQISVKLDVIADNYASVMPLIRDAITRQAHVALGYNSPGAYVQDRFGKSLSRLGVDTRREVVRELAAAGLSTRAIAPVVGVSHNTVAKDLTPSGVTSVTPDEENVQIEETAETVEEMDERLGPIGFEERDEESDAPLTQAECEALDDQDPGVVAEPQKVTGLDGKKYAATSPKRQQRRGDLTGDARRLSQDLRRMTARVQKLASDDRLGRNAEQVASTAGAHLSDCIKACQGLLDALSSQGE